MVKFGSSEIILIVLLLAFLIFSSYFLVDARLQDRVVSVNFSKGVNNVVKALNGSGPINASSVTTSTTVVPKITVTTTTLRLMFFNTNGVPTSAISNGDGNFLINCGSDIIVANRLFMNNILDLNAVLITNMDRGHIGGCGRLLMLMPPAFIMDAGQAPPSDYYSNFLLASSGKRSSFENGMAFASGKVQGSVLYDNGGKFGLGFNIGNATFIYADGCDGDCLDKIIPKNVGVLMLVDGSYLTEERLASLLPNVIITGGSGLDAFAISQKYGIRMFDINKTGDVVLYWDGKKLTDSKAKGL